MILIQEIIVHGPLLDGRGAQVAQDYTEQLQREIGRQALSEVHQISEVSFKHPTPYYETQLAVQQRGPDVVVHDHGVIYGPWLEGVSTRNQTTRFKGYHMFRRATQRVIELVEPYAERIFAQFRGRFEA